jgi:hypothetical protein
MSSKDFPPHALHDYALLADRERGALIGPDGAVNWLRAPPGTTTPSWRPSSAKEASTP